MGLFSKNEKRLDESSDPDRKDGTMVGVDEVKEETGLSKVGLIFGEYSLSFSSLPMSLARRRERGRKGILDVEG